MSIGSRKEEMSFESIELTDRDIFDAMKSIPGFLDITPGDFKELYCHAFRFAVDRIVRSVTAGKIMTRQVVTVRRDTPLAEVAETMGKSGVSGVPVLDSEGRVVGVISEKDFLRRMGAGVQDNFMTVVANCLLAKGCIVLPMRAKIAEDIMTSPAITFEESTPLKEIIGLFLEKGINRAPITGSDGRILGILTRNDIISASAGNAACSWNIATK
jgi:CBS domain-containing membrane protein